MKQIDNILHHVLLYSSVDAVFCTCTYHSGEMIVPNVVLDVGVAVVFVNHFVSLGKTSLQLIFLLGRIQIEVMFGLAIDTYNIH